MGHENGGWMNDDQRDSVRDALWSKQEIRDLVANVRRELSSRAMADESLVELANKVSSLQDENRDLSSRRTALVASRRDLLATHLDVLSQLTTLRATLAEREQRITELEAKLANCDEALAGCLKEMAHLQLYVDVLISARLTNAATLAEREREVKQGKRANEILLDVLEAHRRFHKAAACPGRPECYVCASEEWWIEYAGCNPPELSASILPASPPALPPTLGEPFATHSVNPKYNPPGGL